MKVTVSKSHEPGRKSSWMVRYYKERRPIRKFFATKEEAECYARDVRDAVHSGVNPEDMRVANRLLSGTGCTLSNVVRAGLSFIQEKNLAEASPTMTIDDAAKHLLNRSATRRAKTQSVYKAAFRSISRVFGSRIGSTITAREIEDYLDQLPNRKGVVGRSSAFTKSTVLRYIKMLMSACGVENPLRELALPTARVAEIGFFSVAEVQTILARALPEEKGQVALALFAAIRPETLERMHERHVNVAEKSIRIPAELAKDKTAHFLETVPIGLEREVRPGPPEALWAWLRSHPFKPRAWAPIQRRLKSALNGKWIQDGLRHTGATYYRAKYGDAATAELLTHASLRLVNRHYAGLASRADAEAFLQLTPESVPDQSRPLRLQQKCVCWPCDSDLAEMLTKAPATEVARILGCSDSMVGKYCRLRGIKKPGRGFWIKQQTVTQTN